MLNNFGSFLSPPVQRLLVDSRQDHLTSFCDDSLVTSRLTFNWAGFPTYLNTSLDYAGWSKMYYLRYLPRLF